MKVFTVGFTKKTASEFFGLLKQPGLVRLVDVRLNNRSQLAGFTKRGDLGFFLRELCDLDYVHMPELAPTQEILTAYRKNGGDWTGYEKEFVQVMRSRQIEKTVSKDVIDGACLLCSEATAEHCHRRLVGEYLQEQWGELEIHHL